MRPKKSNGRLTGRCKHLLLSRSADLETLKVSLVQDTHEAVAQWDWTTRSSPIFSFEKWNFPDFSNQYCYMFFIGPIDPAQWDLDIPIYATLGTYNILAIANKDRGDLYDIRDFCAQNAEIRWECWEVNCGEIIKSGCGGGPRNIPRRAKPKRTAVSHGLISAEEENSILFAAGIAKAGQYMPSVAAELEVFAEAFRAHLEHNDGESDNVKLSWLVNVNAHLSRFTSQAFSGVSPIASTESHFWSHSLLGVGVACKALVNIRRFAQIAVGHTDWIDVLDQLEEVPTCLNWTSLMSRVPQRAAAWIDVESAVKTAAEKAYSIVEKKSPSEKIRLPLIVCFSGRDGFRSTPFSLSAPLEVISGANAFGWTPMTTSHEICHVWMSGIIETIFPAINTSESFSRLDFILSNKIVVTNVLDDLRKAFYYCFALLERESLDILDHEECIPKNKQRPWMDIIESHILQVNETLTHILDYQFFYQQDESRYVKSIWSSWDVIPNIKDRLSSYILRTACSLLSERINHDNPIDETLERLRRLLEELANDLGSANYISDALGILQRDNELFKRRLEKRELLVRLAKTFFANRSIAARLEREHQIPGGPYSDLSPLNFDCQQIWNPLRFVSHFSNDKRGDKAKSLWILSKIAFMQDPNETFA